MAELILNPNSIYRKSQANFILNKDALYAFTRSVSAVNNSLYGMQPTKEQLLSGFELSDIFAVNPLSTNGSLCANVYVLDESVNALKFFSSRPFVVCENVADRDEKAQNPFAVYLTPVVPETSAQTSTDVNNDCYEWIYVLSSLEDVSDWDVMVSAYSEWQADKENFRLTSFQGKWELIGSTSLTDEKISSLFNDVSETIEQTATVLSTAIITETEAREAAVSELEENISDICSNYETKEDAAEKLQNAKDYTDDKVSSTIETIAEISAALEEQTNELIDNFNGFVSNDFVPFTEFVEEDLSGALDNEIAERKAADEWLSTTFAENLSDEIKDWVNEQISAIDISDKLSNYAELSVLDNYATKAWVNEELSSIDISDKLSNYAQLSDIPEIPPLSDFVKKSDVSEAIESALSDYQAYADGLEIPGSISVIIDWNKAIHAALKNLTNL